MKRMISFILTAAMVCAMLIPSAFAADSVGKFDDYLKADQPSSGTQASHEWVGFKNGADAYGNVTIYKFPKGTHITMKNTTDYYMEIIGPDSIWPLMYDFIIPTVGDNYVLRVRKFNNPDGIYIYVQGTAVAPSGGDTAVNDDKPIEQNVSNPTLVSPFSDVATTDWFYESVTYCKSFGIMSGTSETTFSPYDRVTNAMIWVMLAKLDEQNVEGGKYWYSKAQEWVKRCGISDGANPNDYASRQQLVTMIYNYAMKHRGFFEVEVEDYKGPRKPFEEYADVSAVSDGARDAMKWAVKGTIISGNEKSELMPHDFTNRAQVATIFVNFREVYAREMYER